MEEIIDTESYQKKKDELLKMKKALQEKIKEIKTKGSSWLEPLKEFIKEAADAAKIARAKNNGKDIAIFAKKVGSNYFLNNRRLEFLPIAPYNLLAESAPDASKIILTPFLCSLYTKIRTYFQNTS